MAETSEFRVLELFAGIGAVSEIVGDNRVVAAVDISTDAKSVYRANHQSEYLIREIDSISNAQFRQWSADLWWLSPPCQPHSRRGHGRDIRDTRSSALTRVIEAIELCQPTHLALENVLGFEKAEACNCLTDCLDQNGYHQQTIKICPTQMGWPNRRPRFYLVASQKPLVPWQSIPTLPTDWESMIDPISIDENHRHLWIPAEQEQKYGCALDRMVPGIRRPTACFTGSYGKTWLHSGSYLQTEYGLRRFTPREVARFLGFPDTYALPRLSERPCQSDRKLWRLLGNSLSVPVIRYLMAHFS